MTCSKLIASSAVALVLTCGSAFAQSPLLVTSTADSGEGSLRAALAAAAEDQAASQIVIMTDGDITISSTLTYTGEAPLTLIGNGQTVHTDENVTLFTASNGADLTVHSVNFTGPGNWSIENRADTDGEPGKGIFVDVRDDQTGVVKLVLDNVTVSGVGAKGVHVSDCSLADACGAGGGGAGEGSPASIEVVLTNVVIDDAGNGAFDEDGLRVDERAEGSITLIADASSFTNVGADGVELDEGQAGDVIVSVTNSKFNDNGAYCNPDLMGVFLPEEDAGEYEPGEKDEADIPGPVLDSLDNNCVERAVDYHDDGSVEEYEIALDLDDGFDVDEAGDGSVYLTMVGTEIIGNLDEGLDFDEADEGGFALTIIDSVAADNTDDGYKVSEEDGGDLTATMIASSSMNNGGKGAVFEEESAGDVMVSIRGMETEGNDDGETSLEIVQDDDGSGTATIKDSAIAEPIEAEGVSLSRM